MPPNFSSASSTIRETPVLSGTRAGSSWLRPSGKIAMVPPSFSTSWQRVKVSAFLLVSAPSSCLRKTGMAEASSMKGRTSGCFHRVDLARKRGAIGRKPSKRARVEKAVDVVADEDHRPSLRDLLGPQHLHPAEKDARAAAARRRGQQAQAERPRRLAGSCGAAGQAGQEFATSRVEVGVPFVGGGELEDLEGGAQLGEPPRGRPRACPRCTTDRPCRGPAGTLGQASGAGSTASAGRSPPCTMTPWQGQPLRSAARQAIAAPCEKPEKTSVPVTGRSRRRAAITRWK